MACLVAALPSTLHAADGELDPGFGVAGLALVIDEGGASTRATAVVPSADGGVLAAGWRDGPSAPVAFAAALSSAGMPVPDYGSEGLAPLALSAVQVWDAALDPHGRLLVSGGLLEDGAGGATQAYVTRLSTIGAPDPTFGDDGTGAIATGEPSGLDVVTGVVVDELDRVVLAGLIDADPFAARLLPSGDADPSCAGGAPVPLPIAGSAPAASSAYAVALAADAIVVAGGDTTTGVAVARLRTADCVLDPAFGEGGVARPDLASPFAHATDVVVDAARRIVATGNAGPLDAALLVRLEGTHGALDLTCGDGGVVALELGGIDQGWDLALAPDGRIVVAGLSWRDGAPTVVLARIRARDCAPDPTFGDGGRADVPGLAIVHDVTVDARGDVLVVGRTQRDPPHVGVVARVEGHAGIHGDGFDGQTLDGWSGMVARDRGHEPTATSGASAP